LRILLVAQKQPEQRVDPSRFGKNLRHIDIDRAGDLLRVRCWLFSTAIEKGQLFRSRVLAAVGPARDDEAWAGGLGSAFAAAPPPLTT
jgi:hypothetical protein